MQSIRASRSISERMPNSIRLAPFWTENSGSLALAKACLTVRPTRVIRCVERMEIRAGRGGVEHSKALVHEEDFVGPCWKRLLRGLTTVVIEMNVCDVERSLQLSNNIDKPRLLIVVELDGELIDSLEDCIRRLRECIPFSAFDIHLDDQTFAGISIFSELVDNGVERAPFLNTGRSGHAFAVEDGGAART